MRFYAFFHLWCNIFSLWCCRQTLSHGSVGWSQFNVDFMHLAAVSQGKYCMFQQSLDSLLKSHQAIKSNFEGANEAEMSYNTTRVNWAIITSLVSYSLLMTNLKKEQKEGKIACVSVVQTIMTITWVVVIITGSWCFSAEIIYWFFYHWLVMFAALEISSVILNIFFSQVLWTFK